MKQLHTPVILTKRGAALSVYLVLLIIFSQAITFSANAQIVINEISASNTSTIQNGLEEYDDWIEIYNSGGSAVNLAGYHLSDDNTNFSLFTFPAYILQPDSHLIVFASDDNRTTISDHWETPMLPISGNTIHQIRLLILTGVTGLLMMQHGIQVQEELVLEMVTIRQQFLSAELY